jgi:hypothetical protein
LLEHHNFLLFAGKPIFNLSATSFKLLNSLNIVALCLSMLLPQLLNYAVE